MTGNEILCTHSLSDTLKLVLNIHSDERRKWPPYSMEGVIYGGSTEVSVCCLCLTQDYIFPSLFHVTYSCLNLAQLMVSVRVDYFSILKLAQERC